MRRVLYRVAASLDGYIAGPRGEVDWIVHDPAVDFTKVYEQVDTGRDIWLFGGSSLFRSLLGAKQVDLVEVLLVPVLLGGGIPLLERGASLTQLALEQVERYPSGLLNLRYRVPDAVNSPGHG